MTIKANTSKLFAVVGVVALLVAQVAMLAIRPASAAGVAVTVSSPANGEFAALTATDVTFGYTSTAEYLTADSDAITVTVNPALPAALASCLTPTTDIDGDAATDGSFGGFSTTGATYTIATNDTTQASTTGVDLCVRFPATTPTGIYSITFTDTNGDFGGALVYVGDDNDVTVTASVSPVLSMAIRNTGDTADTNVCNLGALTIGAVNTCEYRIKVHTNAESGYTVSILADGDLRKAGSGDVADADDLDPVAENSTVTIGTEGYGAAFNGGAATGGSITEAGDFNDDDTPLPFVANNLYSSDGPNTPGATDTVNTALVTLRATIDAGTQTGNYQQLLTHYTVANF